MSRSLELAHDALRATRGDHAEVVVHAERSGIARFAASIVHQPTLIENSVVRVRVLRDSSRSVQASVDQSGRANCSW
jgi:predicted Zn-dependent protease